MSRRIIAIDPGALGVGTYLLELEPIAIRLPGDTDTDDALRARCVSGFGRLTLLDYQACPGVDGVPCDANHPEEDPRP